MENEVIVLKGNQVNLARMLTLLQGLEIEIMGMRLTSKGRTCYSMIKREYGLKGSRKKVYDQFKEMLERGSGIEH